jgi:alpha-tubulin suppressor-like RCC1 family protein
MKEHLFSGTIKKISASCKFFFLCFILLCSSRIYGQKSKIIGGGYNNSVLLAADGYVYQADGSAGLTVFTKVAAGAQTPNNTGFLERIVQVDASNGGTPLALDCNGFVYAWRNNADGQAGVGNTSAVPVPARVLKGAQDNNTDPLGLYLSDVTYVNGGNATSYALMKDGRVMAWGCNTSCNTGPGQSSKGALGDGTQIAKSTPVYVKRNAATFLDSVVWVEGGEKCAMALRANGTVWIWGEDGKSEMNGYAQSNYAVPVTTTARRDTLLLKDIVQIAVGDFTGHALDKNGVLWDWGNNAANQTVGDGTNTDRVYPVKVIGVGEAAGSTVNLTGVLKVSGGQAMSMALMNDARVTVWGTNVNSSNASGGSTNAPAYVKINATTELTNIVDIGSGDSHAFAIDKDGKIYGWGFNTNYQLGLGNATNQQYATLVTIAPTAKAPCPNAFLGPDIALCNPSSVNLYAGTQDSSYRYKWYKDGTLLASDTTAWLNGVNTAGTYKVIITDITPVPTGCGNNAPLACQPSQSTVKVTLATTVTPINANFCAPPSKIVNLGVNDPGNTFDWYDAPTAGNKVKSQSNTYTTPALSASTTYYVEDTRQYYYSTGWKIGSAGGTSPDGLSSWTTGFSPGAPVYMNFTVYKPLTIDSVTISIEAGNGGSCPSGTYTIAVKSIATGLDVAAYNIAVTTPCPKIVVVPVSFLISNPGDYQMYWKVGFNKVGYYTVGAKWHIGVTGLIDFTGTGASGNAASSGFFDWKIKAVSNCARIPVVATLTTTCPPLPINFLSFEAEKTNSNVHLSWSTAELGGNQFFEIERSLDAKKFDVVGKIEAKSGSYNSYSFDDQSAPSGTLYYRIKQYDKDGSFMYSEIRSINDMFIHEVILFPNPSENNFNLSVTGFMNSDFKGEIFSSIGTKVETINGTANKDILFGSSLPSGCYLLKLIIGNDAPRVLKICKL